MSSLFPIAYGLVAVFLLIQALKIMSRGFSNDGSNAKRSIKTLSSSGDRTGRLTIHPEILNKEGEITNEDLLTVRFSKDIDPPKSTGSSSD